MKIAVIGTGVVGQTHAEKLADLDHEVFMGTQNVKISLAKSEPDAMGRPPVSQWLKDHPNVKLVSYSRAAKNGEIIIEALNGNAAVEVLSKIKSNLIGKLLIDISNPLDFSKGRLRLFVSNDSSLAEQIQKILPDTYIVKAFNTMTVQVQIEPLSVAGGDHHLFIAGNDKNAKKQVEKFAKEQYGWRNTLDLGDLGAARGMEMILPIWLDIMKAKGTPMFNFKIAQ
jgi:predicted dinucleotide-binding enzyme